MLLAATAVALVWANSPWSDAYHHCWEAPVTIGAPGFGLTLSLHHWPPRWGLRTPPLHRA